MQHRVHSWEQTDTIIELWSSHLPAGQAGAVAVLNLWRHGPLESGSWLYFHKQAEDEKQWVPVHYFYHLSLFDVVTGLGVLGECLLTKKKIIWNIFKSIGGSIFDKLNKVWTEMLADAKIYGASAMYKADLKTFEKIKVGLESIIDPSSAGKNSLSLWIFLYILWSWDGSHLN